MTPHIVRHSFGTHALDMGVDFVSVAALPGHEPLETTAVYTTPSQRDLKRVAERLAQDGTSLRQLVRLLLRRALRVMEGAC